MGVLNQLLEFLPTYFNVDPQKQLAFMISYDVPGAEMRYSIVDGVICARIGDSIVKDFEVSLPGKTIQQVADQIGAVPHYQAVVVPDMAGKDAICLMDVKDESDARVFFHNSPTWTVLKALALELKEAKAMGDELLRQLSIPGATGLLSDHWGGFFVQGPRRPGESDSSFNQRIIDSIKAPKSNNIAMEIILEAYYGYYIRVIDLDFTQESTFLMNNPPTPVHDVRYPLFDVTSIGKEICVFGLIFPEGTISQWNQARFDDLRDLTNSIRAAGTRAKAFWTDEPVFSPEDVPYTSDLYFYMKYI